MVEREYDADEIADLVAFVLDGTFSGVLSARVNAESDGDRIMVMVYPYEELIAAPSSEGQVFTIIVSDGYAMSIDDPDLDNEEDDDDDDDNAITAWGERF